MDTPKAYKNIVEDIIEEYRNTIKSVLIFLIIAFSWIVFEGKLIDLFNAYLTPILSGMAFSNGNHFLFFSIIFICTLFIFYRIIKYEYHISLLMFLILCMVVIVYAKHRICEDYVSKSSLWENWNYADILIVLLAFYLLLILFVALCSLYQKYKKKTAVNFKFLADIPIDKPESDILDYSESARELAVDLESIDAEKSCSVGLIAPWGTGKTSYLNLLEHYLIKNKFIIIKFNPRHSLSSENIQEDFFKILFSEFKKRDSRFSSSFTDYLKAINILAESKWVSTFLGIQKLWNKDSEKEKINNAIKLINKRIIILIEDFDRLLPNEIIEVFKLIDGNASFTNFIFITAYDKRLINEIVGKQYTNKDTLFTDKFFTLEIQIPLRPYEKVYDFLLNELLEKLNISIENKNIYQTILRKHFELLKEYLTTLRDVKRFLNLFIRQYKKLEREVDFECYFLLYLMKYKYLDEYLALYKKKYVKTDFMNSNPNQYILDEDTIKNVESKNILEILFSKTTEITLRSINNTVAFDIYFHDFVYNSLTIENMETLFDISLDNAKSFIDNANNENKLQSLLTFLETRNILMFDDKEKFERYLDLLIHINCKNYETTIPSFTIFKLLYKENQKQIISTYNYIDDKYKYMISAKIEGSFPDYPFNITQAIISGLINKEFRGDIIFAQEDALEIAKRSLFDFMDKEKKINQQHINMLYSCISEIDPISRNITLDKDACAKMKIAITKEPSGYFEKFVRLGMWSSSPEFNSVACEPFWIQIFGAADNMESFILQHRSKIPNIRLIEHFWDIYKNNNYKPIEFEHQGNVQEKINANLEAEFNDLDTLLDIERQFDELEQDRSRTPRQKDDEVYIKRYNGFLNQIDNIHLYITLRGDISRKINSTIQSMR